MAAELDGSKTGIAIRFRAMVLADVPSIMEIERASYSFP